MKTVFICKSINLRVEGLDNRLYAVDERITLKHRGRWLPMIVDDVVEEGEIRQIVLKVNRSPDSVYLRRTLDRNLRQVHRDDPGWIDGLLDAIEGERGPVIW